MLCIFKLVVKNEFQDTYSIPCNSTSVETVLPLNSAKRPNHLFNH